MKASDIRMLLREWEGNDLLEQIDQYGDISDILEALVTEVETLEEEVEHLQIRRKELLRELYD